MTVYIGVDFHPYEQSVAYVDDRDGEIGYKRFLHSDKQSIRAFFRKCGEDAVIGTEATGSLWWFEKLLFDNGIKLKIGDPRMIRRAALSRHKNDFRDAETILDLLMRDQFPAIVPRSEKSREVLDLLNYRQSLVRKRTSVANQLHAFARSKGLAKFRLPGIKSRKKLVEAPGTTETESLLLSSRLSLFDELTRQIKVTEAKLEEEADKEERIQMIRTHPGIGPLTSLAFGPHARGCSPIPTQGRGGRVCRARPFGEKLGREEKNGLDQQTRITACSSSARPGGPNVPRQEDQTILFPG